MIGLLASPVVPFAPDWVQNLFSFSIGSALTSAVLAWWNHRNAAGIHRARLTYEFVSSWDDSIRDVRDKLNRVYGDHYGDPAIPDGRFGPLEAESVKELYNRLESFAALYRRSYYDDEIIDSLMSGPIMAVYSKYHLLKEKLESGHPRWPVLDELMNAWCEGRRPSRLANTRSQGVQSPLPYCERRRERKEVGDIRAPATGH